MWNSQGQSRRCRETQVEMGEIGEGSRHGSSLPDLQHPPSIFDSSRIRSCLASSGNLMPSAPLHRQVLCCPQKSLL